MTKGVGEISLPFFEKELSDIYNNQVRIVNFAENINESLIILCIKWKNDKNQKCGEYKTYYFRGIE